MKVKLSNGHANIKDFCPLGVGRGYDKKLLENAKSGEQGFDLSNVSEAEMILVLGMLEEVSINEKKLELTEEALEAEMSYLDYEKIKEKCEEIKDPEAYAKKKARVEEKLSKKEKES